MRILVFALVLISTCSKAQPWQQLPDFPSVPRDDAAAFSIVNKVYVGTGLQTGWALASDWYVFDYNMNQWSAIAPMPCSPRQYCTSFSIDSSGYVFGGLDSTGALNELWAYHAATNTWEQKASLPGPGRYASSCPYPGYVACGQLNATSATNEVWFYDATADQWDQRTSLPGVARHRAAGSCEPGSRGYVLGGADSTWMPLADCWKYNPWNDQWTPISALPQPRYGGSAMWSTYHGLTYLFGVTAGGTYLASGLHLENNAWVLSDSLPCARKGAVAIAGFGPLPSGSETYAFDFFGTGLDSTLFRKNDWWGFGFEEGIDELAIGTLRIHPNPGANTLQVALRDHDRAQVTIRDARGAVVRLQVAFGPTTLDMSDQPPGLYTVEALGKGFRARARWIKL